MADLLDILTVGRTAEKWVALMVGLLVEKKVDCLAEKWDTATVEWKVVEMVDMWVVKKVETKAVSMAGSLAGKKGYMKAAPMVVLKVETLGLQTEWTMVEKRVDATVAMSAPLLVVSRVALKDN